MSDKVYTVQDYYLAAVDVAAEGLVPVVLHIQLPDVPVAHARCREPAGNGICPSALGGLPHPDGPALRVPFKALPAQLHARVHAARIVELRPAAADLRRHLAAPRPAAVPGPRPLQKPKSHRTRPPSQNLLKYTTFSAPCHRLSFNTS